MNKRIILSSLALIGFFAVMFLQLVSNSDGNEINSTKEEQVKRGEYLVRFGGCSDCHSPKVLTPNGPLPDESRLLSGHPEGSKLSDFDLSIVESGKWVLFTSDLTATIGPWGATFAINLTPDEQTGIGLWTEEIFINAMHTGKHMGEGAPILPPMPWRNLSHLTDDDLKSIFSYLRTLKPIKNEVPPAIPLSELKAE
jgi:cytochrome c553